MTQMNELFMSLILSFIKLTVNLVLHVTHDDFSETASQDDSH